MNIKTTYQSGIYILTSEQIIKASLNDVWAFFSTPKNLDKITPNDMAFEVTSGELNTMYAGQIISYQIEVLPKIKQSWITEITQVKEKEFFIDEQRFGPYKMWHHEHHFEELEAEKVIMTDVVSYKLPLGLLGRLVAGNIIKNRVESIFRYRDEAVENLFAPLKQ